MFKNGFTLLEMIVAIGVFSVAILIAISSFLNLEGIEKKVQAGLEVQTNLRFALEIMAKEIRTGTSYHCSLSPGIEPVSCPSGLGSFSFKNAGGAVIIYRLNAERIEKSSDGGSVFQPLTASNIKVENLKFYAVGAETGDDIQPRVLINMKASSPTRSGENAFGFQTMVSQRKPAP